MEKGALVVQHVECEGPGLIGDCLVEAGFDLDYVRLYRNDPFPSDIKGLAAVVIMGGPMGVYEEEKYPFIKDELSLIKRAYELDIPLLGVCLGSQMMARAAGARVYPGGKKEIGFYDVRLTEEGKNDALMRGLPEEFTVFQWHGDTFDLPPGAVNLASSDLFAHQLIKVGRLSYGFQFHFEVTGKMVEEFVREGERELLEAGLDPAAILEDARRHLPGMERLGRRVMQRFTNLICGQMSRAGD